MKKTILALAVSSLAMASTNTTTTTTSTQSQFIENLSASVTAGVSNDSAKDASSTNSAYLNSFISSKIGPVNTAMLIRTTTTNFEDDNTEYYMRNIRLYFSGFNTEYQTALGKVTLAPALRVEGQTSEREEIKGRIATLRLGATASLATTAANTLSFSAYTYDHITDGSAQAATRSASNLYLVLANNYSINDNNSLGLTYEYFAGIDQADLSNTGNIANDLTLSYGRTINKNVSMSLGSTASFGKDVSLKNTDGDSMGYYLDATYRF